MAIPSDGDLYEATLAFMRDSGLPVERSSPRKYTAFIKTAPSVTILFQRAGDIPSKIEEGSAYLGITGLDRFMESEVEGSESTVIIEELGFGKCELVMGVPDSWLDVDSMSDLADLSIDMRAAGTDLRVATKYPRLVQSYLLKHGVNYFSLVQSSGTLEVAPAMGVADVIADISSSGTTMRENGLKTLYDGEVLKSQACVIGNRQLLLNHTIALEEARYILEYMEAFLRAKDFFTITANILGNSQEDVALRVAENPDLFGIRGPTVSKVYGDESSNWYAITIVVPRDRMLQAVDQLRNVGGESVTVVNTNYVFNYKSDAFERFLSVTDGQS